MAIFSILKALAPLVVNAGEIVGRIRSAQTTARTEDRLKALEEETVRTGKVLMGVTEQLQAVAQELQAQNERHQAQQTHAKLALVLSALAFIASVSAVVVVLAR